MIGRPRHSLAIAIALALGLMPTGPAQARNLCFAENQCDFRGFTCMSDFEDCQAGAAKARREAAAARKTANDLRHKIKAVERENRNLRAELSRAQSTQSNVEAQMVRYREEEAVWLRERDDVVTDYAAFMICVKGATTLEMAQGCFDK